MAVSALLQQQDTEDSSLYAKQTAEALETYRTMTVHCLISGNYLCPISNTMETLILHFVVDQSTHVDTNIGNWMMIGIIVRIAFRVGLHRDPSHWPSVGPLDAEYWRRLWIVLYHMDYDTSTQVGLPRIIKDSQCDTRLPQNLHDVDLDRGHDVLPPAWPLKDPTPLPSIIQRSLVIKVPAEIYDATKTGPPSPAILVALTSRLQEAIGSVPGRSRYRPLDETIGDGPASILDRIHRDTIW
jgi:hypothetical protein